MIPDEYFDPNAAMYQQQRFTHDCSNKYDRCFVVTRVPDGWKYYCHRCKEFGRKSAVDLSPQEWLAWKKAQEQGTPESARAVVVELPVGFTRELPHKATAYLYSRGITDEDMERYNIGYSPVLNRVIFPVYKTSKANEHIPELVYWTGRTLGEVTDKNPKWNNVKAYRTDVYFEAKPWMSERIVFVEDIVSAIRVSHTENCIGLLSAFIPDGLIFMYRGFEQVFWLDPDKAKRMLHRVKRWRAFDVNVKMIRSSKDPKFYSDEEIEHKLWEVG